MEFSWLGHQGAKTKKQKLMAGSSPNFSKISENHFFPSFPRPTFQNVITHKIFEIIL
jgi:hypothetical protein